MSVKGSIRKYSGSALWLSVLSLLFLVCSVQNVFAAKGQKKKPKTVEYEMTVAAIRPANPKNTFIEVTFSESQRFYKLPNDADPKFLVLLKASEKDHTPVLVRRASEKSDVILRVTKKKH